MVGITSRRTCTLGSVITKILNHEVEFQVVNDDVLTRFDGILGTDALRGCGRVDLINQNLQWYDHEIPLEDQEKMRLEARKKRICYIKVKNPEIGSGYVSIIEIKKGVMTGNALVSVTEDGRACIEIINSNEQDVEVSVPEVVIEEFEQVIDVDEGDLAIDRIVPWASSQAKKVASKGLGRPLIYLI